jgi:hypothetical protein
MEIMLAALQVARRLSHHSAMAAVDRFGILMQERGWEDRG